MTVITLVQSKVELTSVRASIKLFRFCNVVVLSVLKEMLHVYHAIFIFKISQALSSRDMTMLSTWAQLSVFGTTTVELIIAQVEIKEAVNGIQGVLDVIVNVHDAVSAYDQISGRLSSLVLREA